jgi:hypothetical protein
MSEGSLPPVAAVVRFIDLINKNDVAGLGRMMTEDHELRVHDEPPTVGREASIEAWRGYCDSWPRYRIDPLGFAFSAVDDADPAAGDRVVTWGTTTGSHLALPDAEERRRGVIWVALVKRGKVRSWDVREDTPDERDALDVPAGAARAPQ